MLWLGQPECYATWEPAASLPQSLAQQFEGGILSRAEVETAPLCGHVSNVLTVSQKVSLTSDTKRMRKERPCHVELEGYAKFIAAHAHVYTQVCSAS